MVDRRLVNEIEHGKYLARNEADQIWNWGTPAGKIRWKRRVVMLTHLLKSGMKVLEIGCGTGLLTQEIAKHPVHLYAIDISPELVEIAKQNNAGSHIQFTVGNAYHMTFEDQSFDAILGSSVLHHLDVNLALKEFYRVLKPGGNICFTEPNMLNPQIAMQKNIPALKKALGDSPDETAFIIWSIRKKIRSVGFTEVEITPFDFLHPRIPKGMIRFLKPLAELAEKTPLLQQISGSLYIKASK